MLLWLQIYKLDFLNNIFFIKYNILCHTNCYSAYLWSFTSSALGGLSMFILLLFFESLTLTDHCLVRKEKGWNLIVPSPSFFTREVVRTHLHSMKINNKHSWEGKREGPDLLRIVYFLYHERWRFICASIFTASKRLSYPSSLGINVFTTYSSKPREDVGSLVVHAVLPVNQIYQCAQENCDSL